MVIPLELEPVLGFFETNRSFRVGDAKIEVGRGGGVGDCKGGQSIALSGNGLFCDIHNHAGIEVVLEFDVIDIAKEF